jgi:hypothetical protein
MLRRERGLVSMSPRIMTDSAGRPLRHNSDDGCAQNRISVQAGAIQRKRFIAQTLQLVQMLRWDRGHPR